MTKQKISNIFQWALLGIIVISSFLLMWSSSRKESATMDELAHIPSGYSYVRFLDYRLNPEHPPLIKAISAFPLLFLHLNFPITSDAWQKDVNGQWDAGNKFLYKSGNDADRIIQWSRIGPMLLAIILIVFIYLWGRQVLGNWWGLVPSFLFGFSPTVLAHGHYVTTDIGAALGAFAAIYFFSKYLIHPSGKNLLFAGIAMGVAQLLKFSAVLLFPLFIFLMIAQLIWHAHSSPKSGIKRIGSCLKNFFSAVCNLFLIFAVAFAAIYAVYFLFTFKYPIERQVTDTSYTLQSFAGGPDPQLETCKFGNDLPLLRRVRCIAELDILMARNPVLRPAGQYLLGVLMVTQRATGGNTGYFMGEVSAGGWTRYFPVLFATKETIPTLILVLIGLGTAFLSLIKKLSWNPLRFLKRIWKSGVEYLGTNFSEFAMASFIVLYWTYSLKSPLNIGIRHIIPTIPFIYILATMAAKKLLPAEGYFERRGFLGKLRMFFVNFTKKSGKAVLISGLLVWHLAESFGTYPNYISYYNEMAGGTEKGYKIATDSNYDWGQDLKRLKDFVEKKGIQKIAIDYFGGGDTNYYLGDKVVNWWSSRENPQNEGVEWLAISINSIQQAKGKPVNGFIRKPEDEYSWLEKPYEPYAKAGKSIFIYKLK